MCNCYGLLNNLPVLITDVRLFLLLTCQYTFYNEKWTLNVTYLKLLFFGIKRSHGELESPGVRYIDILSDDVQFQYTTAFPSRTPQGDFRILIFSIELPSIHLIRLS